MPKSGTQTIRDIVEDVLQGENETEIDEIVLRNFIKKHAGLDPRTIDKYRRELFETRHAYLDGKKIILTR